MATEANPEYFGATLIDKRLTQNDFWGEGSDYSGMNINQEARLRYGDGYDALTNGEKKGLRKDVREGRLKEYNNRQFGDGPQEGETLSEYMTRTKAITDAQGGHRTAGQFSGGGGRHAQSKGGQVAKAIDRVQATQTADAHKAAEAAGVPLVKVENGEVKVLNTGYGGHPGIQAKQLGMESPTGHFEYKGDAEIGEYNTLQAQLRDDPTGLARVLTEGGPLLAAAVVGLATGGAALGALAPGATAATAGAGALAGSGAAAALGSTAAQQWMAQDFDAEGLLKAGATGALSGGVLSKVPGFGSVYADDSVIGSLTRHTTNDAVSQAINDGSLDIEDAIKAGLLGTGADIVVDAFGDTKQTNDNNLEVDRDKIDGDDIIPDDIRRIGNTTDLHGILGKEGLLSKIGLNPENVGSLFTEDGYLRTDYLGDALDFIGMGGRPMVNVDQESGRLREEQGENKRLYLEEKARLDQQLADGDITLPEYRKLITHQNNVRSTEWDRIQQNYYDNTAPYDPRFLAPFTPKGESIYSGIHERNPIANLSSYSGLFSGEGNAPAATSKPTWVSPEEQDGDMTPVDDSAFREYMDRNPTASIDDTVYAEAPVETEEVDINEDTTYDDTLATDKSDWGYYWNSDGEYVRGEVPTEYYRDGYGDMHEGKDLNAVEDGYRSELTLGGYDTLPTDDTYLPPSDGAFEDSDYPTYRTEQGTSTTVIPTGTASSSVLPGEGAGIPNAAPTEAEWTELFPYTKLTRLQKKNLLPHVNYIRSIK